MAMAHLRSLGKYTGGLEPYGYRRTNGELLCVPEEMDTIRTILRLSGEGESLRGISKHLSEIGVTTRTGKAFLPIQIARILKSSPPSYG